MNPSKPIQHRVTHSRKYALRLLPYFELLLEQVRASRAEGMFLSTAEFGGISPNTLQIRWSDALLWLTRFNIDDKIDRRPEFQHLKDVTKTKKESGGVRIWLMIGPSAKSTLRTITEVKTVSDWKKDLEEFLSGDETIKVFDKVILTEEELMYVKRVVGQTCGDNANVTVSGDRFIISKVA